MTQRSTATIVLQAFSKKSVISKLSGEIAWGATTGQHSSLTPSEFAINLANCYKWLPILIKFPIAQVFNAHLWRL